MPIDYASFYAADEPDRHWIEQAREEDGFDLFPFDPFPDASMPEPIPPSRVVELEHHLARMASRLARVRRALRDTLEHAFPVADKGLAPWYRAAQAALKDSEDECPTD